MELHPSVPIIQLMDDDHSLYCAKVRVALHAKGVTYQSLPAPCGALLQTPEFLAVNPLGKIPALLVQEVGCQEPTALMESEVINEWLEDRFPAPLGSSAGRQPSPGPEAQGQPPSPSAAADHHGHGPHAHGHGHEDHDDGMGSGMRYGSGVRRTLMPSDPMDKAQVRTISRFHDLYFEPALRRLYPLVDPTKRDPAAVAAAVQELDHRLGQLSGLLDPQGSYAVGHNLSLADCAWGAAFLYCDIILPVLLPPSGSASGQEVPQGLGSLPSMTPRIALWREKLAADPSVQNSLEVLLPAALEWLHRKQQGPAANHSPFLAHSATAPAPATAPVH